LQVPVAHSSLIAAMNPFAKTQNAPILESETLPRTPELTNSKEIPPSQHQSVDSNKINIEVCITFNFF
jgi:hypothetical protein